MKYVLDAVLQTFTRIRAPVYLLDAALRTPLRTVRSTETAAGAANRNCYAQNHSTELLADARLGRCHWLAS